MFFILSNLAKNKFKDNTWRQKQLFASGFHKIHALIVMKTITVMMTKTIMTTIKVII